MNCNVLMPILVMFALMPVFRIVAVRVVNAVERVNMRDEFQVPAIYAASAAVVGVVMAALYMAGVS